MQARTHSPPLPPSLHPPPSIAFLCFAFNLRFHVSASLRRPTKKEAARKTEQNQTKVAAELNRKNKEDKGRILNYRRP